MLDAISLTQATRQNLLALRVIGAQESIATRRLATGLRVETPLDDVEAFFAAKGLTGRADGLASVLDSFHVARSALSAADSALGAAMKLIDEMQIVLSQMDAQTVDDRRGLVGVTGSVALTASTDINTLTASNLYAETWQNRRILVTADGENASFYYGFHGTTVGDLVDHINASMSKAEASLDGDGHLVIAPTDPAGRAMASGYNPELEAALGLRPMGYYWDDDSELLRQVFGWRAGLTLTTDMGTLSTSTDTVQLVEWRDGRGNTFSFDTASGNTIGDLVDAVNADADFGWSLDLDGDGRLVWTAESGVDALQIMPVPLYNRSMKLGLMVPDASTGTGGPGSTSGGTADVAPGDAQAELSDRYARLVEQYDQIVGDAAVQHVNLLRGGHLDVDINERGSKLRVRSLDVTAATLGLEAPDARKIVDRGDVAAMADAIEDIRGKIEAAAIVVSVQAQILDTREDFNEAVIRTLKRGADALLLADANEESARLLALQTARDLATTAMSLGADAERTTLRMFDVAAGRNEGGRRL